MIFSKRRLKLTEQEADLGVTVGLYFGYPECCARSFMERHTHQTYGGMSYPLAGTGFVPCPLCAATYTDEELLEYIEANRRFEVPFAAHADNGWDWDKDWALKLFWIDLTTQGVEIGNRKTRSHEESAV